MVIPLPTFIAVLQTKVIETIAKGRTPFYGPDTVICGLVSESSLLQQYTITAEHCVCYQHQNGYVTEVAWWEVAARAIIIWRWVSNILNRGSPHQLFAMKEHIRDYQYLIAIVQKMMAAVTSKNSGQTEEEAASVM